MAVLVQRRGAVGIAGEQQVPVVVEIADEGRGAAASSIRCLISGTAAAGFGQVDGDAHQLRAGFPQLDALARRAAHRPCRSSSSTARARGTAAHGEVTDTHGTVRWRLESLITATIVARLRRVGREAAVRAVGRQPHAAKPRLPIRSSPLREASLDVLRAEQCQLQRVVVLDPVQLMSTKNASVNGGPPGSTLAWACSRFGLRSRHRMAPSGVTGPPQRRPAGRNRPRRCAGCPPATPSRGRRPAPRRRSVRPAARTADASRSRRLLALAQAFESSCSLGPGLNGLGTISDRRSHHLRARCDRRREAA